MPRPLTTRLRLNQVAHIVAYLPEDSLLRKQLIAAVKLNTGQRPKLMDLTAPGLVSAREFEELTGMDSLGGIDQ